jgi:predicted metal-dependent hydrolase
MFEPEILQTPWGDCALIRRPRKTLGISVLPDGSLELVAPLESSHQSILEKVKRRRQWIRRQRAEFSSMNSHRPPLRYCSGATHRYLGRQYRLRVSQKGHNSVKLKNGYFWIETTNTSAATVENLLEHWMRAHAKQQFERRLAPWQKWCARHKLPAPQVRIRKMDKRWGSAQANGSILLNPILIRTPSICIDYVIAHEVCHLKHRNHDQAFYRLLSENFPTWQSAKLRLELAEF